MTIVARADALAAAAHDGQVRKGNSLPYIDHPRGVARILADAGCDDETVAAALLHDTVEDAGIRLDDIARDFGPRVAEAVRDVSEDKSGTWEARKRRAVLDLRRLPTASVLVALADRIETMRCLRLDVAAGGDDVWRAFKGPFTRQRRYYRSLAGAFEARIDLPEPLVAEARQHVDALFQPAPFDLGPLLAAVRARTTSAASLVHGDAHWRTVAAVALSLLEVEPTADPAVVFSFALLHDTMRVNDHRDPLHGPRAAELAWELHGDGVLGLDLHQLAVLCHALEHHASGTVADDPTTAVCWDADRLTLWRCRIHPDPRFLSSAVDDWAPWIERWYDVWAEDDWPVLHEAFSALE